MMGPEAVGVESQEVNGGILQPLIGIPSGNICVVVVGPWEGMLQAVCGWKLERHHLTERLLWHTLEVFEVSLSLQLLHSATSPHLFRDVECCRRLSMVVERSPHPRLHPPGRVPKATTDRGHKPAARFMHPTEGQLWASASCLQTTDT
ncbi:hypothetical protein Y1Q_0003208 [Alligator mississippiensis]|uniref:Uncharacterized protein n=1 Tax=Alligator mississippiensis TaxID=8496 RepID=A0A151MDV0_ALLMI|nr:hypothetical protein Y1Q_0003208 [Alligator mississippiensis]